MSNKKNIIKVTENSLKDVYKIIFTLLKIYTIS